MAELKKGQEEYAELQRKVSKFHEVVEYIRSGVYKEMVYWRNRVA